MALIVCLFIIRYFLGNKIINYLKDAELGYRTQVTWHQAQRTNHRPKTPTDDKDNLQYIYEQFYSILNTDVSIPNIREDYYHILHVIYKPPVNVNDF